MSDVTISVNERRYRLKCESGQEMKLADLARDIDQRIKPLAERYGNVGDDRLILLVALEIADELHEMRGKIDEVSDLLNQSEKLREISSKVLQNGKDFREDDPQIDLEEVIDRIAPTPTAMADVDEDETAPIALDGLELSATG